ncbi:MAG: 1-acyl-sn-glycerol-3-phosphate acyltransferase [Pseudomonadales bacterium]|nr:1-acyl-sn-glycerol-3-phosphate acyltransferase [Pseudomonadales bacterium]
MDEFNQIRPYQDDEIRPVVDGLLTNQEFIRSIARYYYPRLSRYLLPLLEILARKRLGSQLQTVVDVATMQDLIAEYMDKMIRDTTSGLTHSGLDRLSKDRPYLFISNHRDIAMDPAFVNYVLHQESMDTCQIAIGDNLLKKPFVADLMRLNKSFIVHRSLKGRELLKALDLLSRYIHHCIDNQHNVWIAQREGRAKNGIDETEPALIKMLAMGQRKVPLRESLSRLHLVPVAISYQFDACDKLKAQELYQLETTGKFEKTDQSDIHSIVTGIIGQKGKVHLGFGEELTIDTDDPDAVAATIDAQILANYRLQDTNFLALRLLKESSLVTLPTLADTAWNAEIDPAVETCFHNRLAAVDSSLHRHFLQMYANPVIRRFRIGQG